MTVFTRMTESLGVQTKLALAFACVLCFGSIVTCTGFYSAYALSGLVEKITLAGEIRTKTQQLKASEQRVIFIADEASRQQRVMLLSKLVEEVNDALSVFDLQGASDLKRLQTLLAERDADFTNALNKVPSADAEHSNEYSAYLNAADAALNVKYEALETTVNALSEQLLREKGKQVALIYYLLGGVTLFTFFMSAFAVLFVSRQLVPPLKLTVKLAERIASGDLRDVGETQRKDEVGQLQTATRSMAVGLRHLVGDINRGAAQLVSSSSDLSQICTQAKVDVECQQQAVAQVSTAVNELLETVHAIARTAEDAMAIAVLADEKARNGEQVVNKTVDFIGLLSLDMTELGDAMERLQTDSSQINQVVDVIKSVAEQTNLLALNAAIEAARAGEQGRGFAVVADEVRALAMRTQQSTKEIERLVASLQQGSEAAGGLTQRGKLRTYDVVSLVEQVRVALLEIAHAVADIQAMNHRIAASAEEQGSAVVQINQSMVDVHKMANESAIMAGQTMHSSNELARLGNVLQNSVGRFCL